jgi:ribosome biogenesis GTPase
VVVDGRFASQAVNVSNFRQLLSSNHFATAQVRSSDDRGCHTTTHRELVRLSSGALLMDMPGLREIALWANAEVPWAELFADIAELATACRYRDCQHQSEPGCAVRAAIESGTLAPGRLQSFIKQQRELDYNRARQDGRARQVQTQRQKLIAQSARQLGKFRGKHS